MNTEPLITEKQAKDLFTNLLYGQKKRSDEPLAAKSADEQIIKEPSSAETSNTPQAELAREESQEELDAASYIEDDAEREKAFKARYVHLHNEVQSHILPCYFLLLELGRHARFKCVKVSVLAHPEEGADVFLLVATPSSKIFSFTTPKLQPMIKTPVGQNMIKTFLNAKPLPTPPAHTCASHSQV